MPTDFQDDQVILRASSFGGLATVSDEAYVPAASADAIRGSSGLGAFDTPALGKRLQGVRAGASVGIGRSSESVSAAGPPDELETMLQLVTLQFTQPRFTAEGLERYRRNR